MRPIRVPRQMLLLPLAGCLAALLPPADAVAPSLTLPQAMLRAHAFARASVGLPPLAWSAALAGDAQGWADALARTGTFEHAAQDREGENLWMGTRGAFRYDEMAGYWLAERRNFIGPDDPLDSRTGNFDDVGHYSQIVWRDTTEVGCALASNRRDDILVCRYDPPGNVEGERAY